jgi:hypothetical protein
MRALAAPHPGHSGTADAIVKPARRRGVSSTSPKGYGYPLTHDSQRRHLGVTDVKVLTTYTGALKLGFARPLTSMRLGQRSYRCPLWGFSSFPRGVPEWWCSLDGRILRGTSVPVG